MGKISNNWVLPTSGNGCVTSLVENRIFDSVVGGMVRNKQVTCETGDDVVDKLITLRCKFLYAFFLPVFIPSISD